jgi:hypothetical protein
MRTRLLAVTLATIGFAGAANAAVVAVETSAKTPNTFEGDTVGSRTGTAIANGVGISYSTGATNSYIKNGSSYLVLAPGGTTYNYLYAYGGVAWPNTSTATVTFDTDVSSFYFFWGSIDGRAANNNVLTLDLAGGGTDTITGEELVAEYPALKGDGTVSQWFTISDTLGDITGFTAGSYAVTPPGLPHSFEFDLTEQAVPETSTWAMMVLGFAGLGYAAFRRGGKARPAIA